MKNTLPAIKRVEWFAAAVLQCLCAGRISEGILLDSVSGSSTDLEIEGLGSLTIQSEKQSGQDVYTSIFACKKAEEVGVTALTLAELSRNDVCYRLTDVTGQQYMLGTPEKPFTTLSYKYDNAETPAGVRIFALEIKYINRFSVLAIK